MKSVGITLPNDTTRRLAASNEAILVAFDPGIWEVDPRTGRVTKTIPLDVPPDFLTFGFGSIWATNFDANVVLRIDPATGKVLARIPTYAPQGIVTAGGEVWVANHETGAVSIIDPKTNQHDNGVTVGPSGSNGPQGMAVIGGKVWVGASNASEVVAIDPTTRAVATTITGVVEPCGDMASSESRLWVSECAENREADEIDPGAGTFVQSTLVGGYVGTPLAVADGAWLPLNYPQRLLKVSDANGEPVDAVGLPSDCGRTDLNYATVAFGSDWIGCGALLVRLDPADLP